MLDKEQLIVRDPDILSNTPVFAGTRVPVQTLIDYLEAGNTLDEFLDDFPTIDRIKAEKALYVIIEKNKISKS